MFFCAAYCCTVLGKGDCASGASRDILEEQVKRISGQIFIIEHANRFEFARSSHKLTLSGSYYRIKMLTTRATKTLMSHIAYIIDQHSNGNGKSGKKVLVWHSKEST